MIKTTGFLFNGKVYRNKGLQSAAQKRAAQIIISGFKPQAGVTDLHIATTQVATYVFSEELKLGYQSLGNWVFWAIEQCSQVAGQAVAIRNKEMAAAKELQAKKQIQWDANRKKNQRAAKMAVGGFRVKR